MKKFHLRRQRNNAEVNNLTHSEKEEESGESSDGEGDTRSTQQALENVSCREPTYPSMVLKPLSLWARAQL